MKMAESEKIALVSFIIDFDDIQVRLRLFSLNLNACKVMKAFLIFSGQILKETINVHHNFAGIEIKGYFKLNNLNETCISSKSIMQLTKTILSFCYLH